MPYVPPPKPAARKEPDQLPLALLGTVIGQSEAIGVFLNKFSNEVIRLRIRENHGGWTLLSADRAGASFEKDNMEVTLTFSRRDAEQPDRSVANDAAPMEQQAVHDRQQLIQTLLCLKRVRDLLERELIKGLSTDH